MCSIEKPDISEDSEDNSDDTLKIVIDSPSRKKQPPQLNENDKHVIQEVEDTIEKALDEKAAKANLNAKYVKNILKHVCTNEHVLALVRKAENPEVQDDSITVYEPKLTRAKAKELSNVPNVPWVPPKTTETHVLVGEDLQEDSSGDEYIPGEEESEDDRDSSVISDTDHLSLPPATPPTPSPQKINYTEDGVFKIPPAKSKEQIEEEEEAANIALRTRSKLSLSATPLEEIEESFIPPDITTDMYDMDCDDDDWTDFLKKFTRPLDEVTKGGEDEDHDPEYNILADEEIDKIDKEELRMDKAVKVSRKELNDLMTELFEFANNYNVEGDQRSLMNTPVMDTSSMNKTVEEDSSTVVYRTNTTTSFPTTTAVTKKNENDTTVIMIDSQQITVIEQQMRQHVQMLTQTFLLTYMHPELHMESFKFKEYLYNLQYLCEGKNASLFYTINLYPATNLISEWEKLFLNNDERGIAVSQYVKNVLAESMKQKNSGCPYICTFPPLFLDTVLNSEVFLYPSLLPKIPFKSVNFYTKVNFTPAEDHLIALGFEQFEALAKEDKRNIMKGGIVNMNVVSSMIQKYMMPLKRVKSIYDHVQSYKYLRCANNPIRYYFQHHKAPTLIHYVYPLDRMNVVPPCQRPLTELPYQYQEYLKKKQPKSPPPPPANTTALLTTIITFTPAVVNPIGLSTNLNVNKFILPKISNTVHPVNRVHPINSFVNTELSLNSFVNTVLPENVILNTVQLDNTILSTVQPDIGNTVLTENIINSVQLDTTIVNNIQPENTVQSENIVNTVQLDNTFVNTVQADKIIESTVQPEDSFVNIAKPLLTSTPIITNKNIPVEKKVRQTKPAKSLSWITKLVECLEKRPSLSKYLDLFPELLEREILPLNMLPSMPTLLTPVKQYPRDREVGDNSTSNSNPSVIEKQIDENEVTLCKQKVLSTDEEGSISSHIELDSTTDKFLPSDSSINTTIQEDETPAIAVKKEPTNEKDNLDDINALLKASTTVCKNAKKEPSGAEKKRAKIRREFLANLAICNAEDPEVTASKDEMFALSYYDKLRETLDLEDYHKVMQILNDHEGGDAVDLYKKMITVLKPKYEELAEEFLLFLRDRDAAAVGQLIPWIQMSTKSKFLRKLELYFKDQPAQLRKIFKCLTELSQTVDVTMEKIKSTLLPMLKGNETLTDLFLQNFLDETPPKSLLEGTYESIDVSKEMARPDNEEICESIVIPDTEDVYGSFSCICHCHKIEDPEFKSRYRHCIPCGTKFIQGKVYIQSGRGMRPATVSFLTNSDKDHNLRLNGKSMVNTSRRKRSENSPSKQLTTSPNKDNCDEETDDDVDGKKKIKAKSPRKRKKQPDKKTTKEQKRSKKSPPKNCDSSKQPKKRLVTAKKVSKEIKTEIVEDVSEIKIEIVENDIKPIFDLEQQEQLADEPMEWDGNASVESNDLKTSSPGNQTAESESEFCEESSQDNCESDSNSSSSSTSNTHSQSDSNTGEDLTWRRDEDKVILETFQKENDKEHAFTIISKKLKDRTVPQIRHRFQTLMTLLLQQYGGT